jgi:hypothetical protein
MNLTFVGFVSTLTTCALPSEMFLSSDLLIIQSSKAFLHRYYGTTATLVKCVIAFAFPHTIVIEVQPSLMSRASHVPLFLSIHNSLRLPLNSAKLDCACNTVWIFITKRLLIHTWKPYLDPAAFLLRDIHEKSVEGSSQLFYRF